MADRSETLTEPGAREPQVGAPGDRLSKLSEAGLRINETLDFDSVLQDVVDAARVLTASRYGAITVFGEPEQLPDFIVSGMTQEEHQKLWDIQGGQQFFDYLSGLQHPLRVADISSRFAALGLPVFLPSVPINSVLVAPIRTRGAKVGVIYLTKGQEGLEFTQEDEETLVMFASQAALVIANARRHRDEQRARTKLETLIETSPVGVLVFEARTGALVSYNREVLRIGEELCGPGRPLEEVLSVVKVHRGDGQEFSIEELSRWLRP